MFSETIFDDSSAESKNKTQNTLVDDRNGAIQLEQFLPRAVVEDVAVKAVGQCPILRQGVHNILLCRLNVFVLEKVEIKVRFGLQQKRKQVSPWTTIFRHPSCLIGAITREHRTRLIYTQINEVF